MKRIDPDDVCAVLAMIRWLDQQYINGTLSVSDWVVNGPGTIAGSLDRLTAATGSNGWEGRP